MKSILKTFAIVCVCLLCLGMLGSMFGMFDEKTPLPDDTQENEDSSDETKEPVMIDFTVGGTTYTCPEGYTWKQFYDSDYSQELRTQGDYTIYDGFFGYQGSQIESEDTVIQDGHSY